MHPKLPSMPESDKPRSGRSTQRPEPAAPVNQKNANADAAQAPRIVTVTEGA